MSKNIVPKWEQNLAVFVAEFSLFNYFLIFPVFDSFYKLFSIIYFFHTWQNAEKM